MTVFNCAKNRPPNILNRGDQVQLVHDSAEDGAERSKTGKGFRSTTIRGLALALGLLSIGPPAARGLVTSDGVGTHVVAPGVPAFGVDLDGVVMVGLESFNSGSTGALISDTHVLTAAHVIELGPFFFSVRFDLPDGSIWIPIKGYAIHPDYDPETSNNDVAVIELASPAPAGVPRYELYTDNDEVGKTTVLTGYGQTGSGETGATFTDGAKRAGLNLLETTGADILTMYPEGNFAPNALYADFDSGLAANDFSLLATGFADLGFGDDEVGLAPGDSGGPAFIQGGDGIFRIAGINTLRQGGGTGLSATFDFLEGLNSSWGEFVAVARVSASLAFIEDALAGNLRRQRIFDDGLTHLIDDGLDAGPVFVENSPAPGNAATSVTLDNAIVRSVASEDQALVVEGNSFVEMRGGLIEGNPAARVLGDGRLQVSDGMVKALPSSPVSFIDDSWAIFANENGEVRVSGGMIEGIRRGVNATVNSQVFISGGTFTAEDEAFHTDGNAEIDGGSFSSAISAASTGGNGSLTIRGGLFSGEVDGLFAYGDATVRISGGTFAGGESDFFLEEAAVVRIHGYGFNHPLGPVADDIGTITGFYPDGTPFSHTFDLYDDSVLELVFDRNPVAPRASSQLSLSGVSRFGPTEVGNRSRTQRIEVSNTGTLPIFGIKVRLTGRGKRDFVVTRAPDRNLAPGEATTFKVAFRPRKAGRRNAEAKVRSSAGAVSLRLKGRASPVKVVPRRPRGLFGLLR